MVRNKLIVHIIETLAIVVISFFVWNNNRSEINANIAASYKNRNVATTFDGFKVLEHINDSDYESLKSEKLYIRNISQDETSYKLYYVYSTESTISHKTIKLSLDNKVYDLSEMSYEIQGEYFLFFLDEGTISPYTTLEYDARVWTTAVEGSLTSNFITK